MDKKIFTILRSKFFVHLDLCFCCKLCCRYMGFDDGMKECRELSFVVMACSDWIQRLSWVIRAVNIFTPQKINIVLSSPQTHENILSSPDLLFLSAFIYGQYCSMSIVFIPPRHFKSAGYYVIPSIQKIEFECPSICLSVCPSVRPSVRQRTLGMGSKFNSFRAWSCCISN